MVLLPGTGASDRERLDEIVNRVLKLAWREIQESYPNEEYIPLVVVIPVNRAVVKEARWRDQTSRALRRMMHDVVDAVQWPE